MASAMSALMSEAEHVAWEVDDAGVYSRGAAAEALGLAHAAAEGQYGDRDRGEAWGVEGPGAVVIDAGNLIAMPFIFFSA